jgi:hypothetical protein
MARNDQDTTLAQSANIGEAITALTEAVSRHRDVEDAAQNVIEQWRDLDFDDRRYLGTAFPKLVAALLLLEDV